MRRRQLTTYDDWAHPEYTHQSSPRKWRSMGASIITGGPKSAGYATTYMSQSRKGFYSPGPGSTEHSWIGKKILYWNGESVSSYVTQIRNKKYGPHHIGEYEISLFSRPNEYRFIYVDREGKWRSKPTDDYQAARMNLLIDPDDIIRRIVYF
jgi:hypothetical protein